MFKQPAVLAITTLLVSSSSVAWSAVASPAPNQPEGWTFAQIVPHMNDVPSLNEIVFAVRDMNGNTLDTQTTNLNFNSNQWETFVSPAPVVAIYSTTEEYVGATFDAIGLSEVKIIPLKVVIDGKVILDIEDYHLDKEYDGFLLNVSDGCHINMFARTADTIDMDCVN